MRPFVALTFVMGCAFGAPADVAVAGGVGYAGLGLAGVHGLGYAAAPAALGYAAAAPAVAAAAPIAYGAEHYSAGPVVAHAPVAYAAPAAPAPYTTATQGAGVTTVHQPAPVVTKQVHLGQTSYVSGYATKIHKPAPPIFPSLSQLSLREPTLSTPPLSRPRLKSTMSRIPSSLSARLMPLMMLPSTPRRSSRSQPLSMLMLLTMSHTQSPSRESPSSRSPLPPLS
eukprot:TRINITY_DN88_c0_g1_i16.p1 TRINITY_DN88_c0_g1~~TRINITY_DN88_c0_g1_i16.p1  ORF type:complete len:226 (-),score=34.18 TRINITY_DN88_c0_g1_i16:93-770(-)